MNAILKMALVALLATGFYTYIGNSIPQMRWLPPEKKTISATMSPAELANVGREIFFDRGCAVCHQIVPGQEARGPNLSDIGAKKDVKYLVNSLYAPSVVIAEGFPDIMPPANKAPAKLTDDEITATTAFLQGLGGKSTVKIGDITPPAEAIKAAERPGTKKTSPGDARALIEKYACLDCHKIGDQGEDIGPPLDMIGQKSADYIRESILEPGKVITKGYEDMMQADLGTEMSALEFETIVKYLGGLK